VAQLRAMVSEVLNNPSYGENANRLQGEIRAAGGVRAAADLIESCIQG